jgi:tryptophan 2,3-dioxygenase
MSENPFDGPYGDGKSEYERYLRTSDLLPLQKPPDRRSHPDELMFQTIHQVEELWMKLVVHELGEAVVCIAVDRFADACRALARVDQVQTLVERQLKLFETMLPGAYIHIRTGLGQGSGLDSPGFKRIHELAPAIWEAFERALARAGVEILEVYERPGDHPDLIALAERLVTFDAQMQRFKLEHLMTVRRIIGTGTASLRGNPAEMLERSAHLTFFPLLWAVRDRLFMDFKSGPLAT